MNTPLTHAECEAEVRKLRLLNQQLVSRLAAACEVLGRIANRDKLTCRQCGCEWTLETAKEEAA